MSVVVLLLLVSIVCYSLLLVLITNFCSSSSSSFKLIILSMLSVHFLILFGGVVSLSRGLQMGSGVAGPAKDILLPAIVIGWCAAVGPERDTKMTATRLTSRV